MKYPDDFVGKVIHADCRSITPLIPDKVIAVIITDPVWPNCNVAMVGDDDPYGLLTSAAKDWPRISNRVIVVMACNIDPRMLYAIPPELPFVRACWMRRVPVKYRGPVMVGADIGYVFGHNHLAVKGTRVMPGETFPDCDPKKRFPRNPHECVAVYKRGRKNTHSSNFRITNHPCPRMLDHMCWLVQNFTKPGDLILDPFCGSGTTLEACKRAGRRYVGIEIDPDYADNARKALEEKCLFEKNREEFIENV